MPTTRPGRTGSGARYFLPFVPVRIGMRLYLLAGLALATVMVLATAALHFVMRAGEEAGDIRNLVEIEIMQVGELELGLERHRRIVESAPVELDRVRIGQQRVRARGIITDMLANAPKQTPDAAEGPAHR